MREFQFSRAFSLDVRIFTEARFGFGMELLLVLPLKCSPELPRDVTGTLTGAFPTEFALELALELAFELALEPPLSNTFLYVVLTLQREPNKEQQPRCEGFWLSRDFCYWTSAAHYVHILSLQLPFTIFH